MWKLGIFPDASIVGESNEVIREKGALVINKRSWPDIPIYIILFLAVAFTTNIFKRYPVAVTLFGLITFTIAVFRAWVSFSFENFRKKRHLKRWNNLFQLGNILAATTWGLGTALTLAVFEISWTSFFVLLMTCAICAHTLPAFLSDIRMLTTQLVLMLAPSILMNIFYVPGLQGKALSLFFTSYFLLLFIQGRIQYINHWMAEKSRERMRALLDAMPGTLALVSKDLVYLGVNRKLTQIWNVQPKEFIGQKIGFLDKSSTLDTFCKDVLNLEDETKTLNREVIRNIAGLNKRYLMVGSKCNGGAEAIIIGLDITEQKSMEDELNKFKHLSKLLCLGEITKNYYPEVHAPLQSIQQSIDTLKSNLKSNQWDKTVALEKIETISSSINKIDLASQALDKLASQDNDSVQDVKVNDLIQEGLSLNSERMREHNVQVYLEISSPNLSIRCRPKQVFQVLINLINNAYDEIQDKSEKWLKITAKEADGKVLISVIDSGKGIPKEIQSKIFEPLFSTKTQGETTGLGLSLSREYIEKNSGSLILDKDAPNTSFLVSLPKGSSR